MIRLRWTQGGNVLRAWDRMIVCSCVVKTLAEGTRPRWMIVRTLPGDKPYDPLPFPKGVWKVGTPRARIDPYKAPFFVPTNAFQSVEIWEVEDRAYTRPTGEFTRDEGYGLHFSTSRTTLGCVKIEDERDVLWIVDRIEGAFGKGESVEMEVT